MVLPRLETIEGKKLVGKRLRMSFSGNRTGELWRSFMPSRKEIRNTINEDLISMKVYDLVFEPEKFSQDDLFDKWAAREVSTFEEIPAGMETFFLKGGLYAVFIYRGAASEGDEMFRHIFGKWLPESGYLLDDRPHFEILGEKYKNEHPDSEEEIWIPVKAKSF
jgi:AraC family transcriptional regulator